MHGCTLRTGNNFKFNSVFLRTTLINKTTDSFDYFLCCILLGESAKEKEVIFVLSDECNASHAPISCN